MKMLGIIPARGGSKGILKKNMKLLNGKPLIAYTIEAALNSNLDRVVVSTDCQEIAEVSKQCGVEVIMRASELAKDNTPTLPVLQYIVANIDGSFDAIVTLQPTSPFRSAYHINQSIEIFNKEIAADSLVSVVEIPHSMSSEKSMLLENNVLAGNVLINRRQEINKTFARNGAIYITRMNRISEYIFGGHILPYIMDKVSSIDIDDSQDWELSELVLRGMEGNWD